MHEDVLVEEEEDKSFVRGQNDREMLELAGALSTYFGKAHLEAGTIFSHACAAHMASVRYVACTQCCQAFATT